MTGIYKITNLLNGKVYIGQSVDVQARLRAHRTRPFINGHNEYNSVLHRAIRKYGLENFNFELLEECKQNELNDKECFYIECYNAMVPNGYNVTAGGSHRKFTKLTIDQYESLIYDLANTKILYKELAEKYGVSLQYISYINVGKYLYNEALIYPIRKTQKSYKNLPTNHYDILDNNNL